MCAIHKQFYIVAEWVVKARAKGFKLVTFEIRNGIYYVRVAR